jgi:signal transduction histidine kinase
MILLGEKLASVYPQGRLVGIVKAVNLRIMLSVILMSPIVAIIGIFLSHKIAGPIARMERFLAGMAGGDLRSKITLRKGDELAGLAEGINNLSENLRIAVSSHKARVDKMLGDIESLSAKSGDQSLQRRIKEDAMELSREFDKFKL